MNKYTKLAVAIDNALEEWDGRSRFKLYGVAKLNLEEVEQIQVYNDAYSTGMQDILDQPVGSVREVLTRAGIIKTEE